jgi:surfactin synthase thioesterase subunit
MTAISAYLPKASANRPESRVSPPESRVSPLNAASRWIPARPSLLPDVTALFCLPHAGAGASVFRGWRDQLPGVAVLPVQPPGRETRLRDAPHHRMEPLAAELAAVIMSVAEDRRYAVYGHSLGALVAFETLREIRRLGGPEPAHLVVSGCVAPQCSHDDGESVAQAPLHELVEKLRQLGGTPEWLLADPSVLDMIVPPIRADFTVKESYEYRHEPPLDVPLTVLASTDDPRAPHDLQDRWRDQTTAAFRLHTLLGGHFAVFERAPTTHRYLAAALTQ